MAEEETLTNVVVDPGVDLCAQVDALLASLPGIPAQEPERTLDACKQAFELAEKIGYTAAQIQAALTVGRIEVRLGHYDTSLLYYTRASTLAEKVGSHEQAALAYLGTGFIYTELGESAAAQQNYLKAYQQAHGVADDTESAALNNLAVTYIGTGEYLKAIEYLNKALPLARRSNDSDTINAVLDSLADLYLKLNLPDKALEYALESVELARGTDPEVGDNLITLGRIYLAKGDYQQARDLFTEAIQVSVDTHSFRTIIRGWLMIGVVQRMEGRQEEAMTTLLRAYQLAMTEVVPLFQAECLFELYSTYKQAEDYLNALKCFEQYHVLKEHIYNERSDMRMKTLEVLHQVETARQDAELYQLRTVELQHEIEERLKMESILNELATHDSLTGMVNRREFIRLGENLLAQSASTQQPLSLIVYDLDYFKKINDTFGHLAGDFSLRALAEKIRALVRHVDVCARLGGDEFAILLPETGPHAAMMIAERLRKGVGQMPVRYENAEIQMTLSLGVAVAQEDETNIDTFFSRADKCLYAAKQLGRNRVECDFKV